MTTTARGWLAFSAIGVGLIHLALVIGAPLPLALALGALGFAEFGWGVLTFAWATVPLPRAALVVAIAPILLWSVGLAATIAVGIGRYLPVLPLAGATVLEVIAIVILTRFLRSADDAAAPQVGRSVAGVAVALAVVVLITGASLAVVQSGFSEPGETVDLPFDLPLHGH